MFKIDKHIHKFLNDNPSLLSLLKCSHDILICLNLNYRILFINKPAEQHYKWKAEEVLGKNYLDICANYGFESPFHNNIDLILLSKKTPTSREIVIVLDNAIKHMAKWTITPLRDKNDSAYGFILVGKDISAEKTKKEANTNAFDYFAKAVSLIPGTFFWKDLDGKYLGCSPSFLEIFKLAAPEDLIGKTDFDLWGKNMCVDNFVKNNQKVIKTGKSSNIEEELILHNKVHKHFLALRKPIRDHNETIIGLIGNLIDITHLKRVQKHLVKEKKQAETVSRRVQHYLETIVDSLPGSIYWKNKEGVYLGCNAFMIQTAGLNSPADIVGKNDYELWREQADDLRKNDIEVMETGKAVRLEETVKLPNGKQRYFTVVKLPLRNEDGLVVGIVGNSLEITDLKLAQFELEQEKKRAEAANQAKSHFLATVSHELRTPLNGILGISHTLLKDKLTSKQLDYINDINQAGTNLLMLVNDVLDFSKLEAGKVEFKNELFNLKNLIMDIISKQQHQIEDKKLKIDIHYDNHIPTTLMGDQLRIRQILVNLLTNAIKFTKKGQIKIGSKVVSKDSQTVVLNISLKDTGVGIPADQLERIFERFTQVESKYSRRFEGTGLGLSICKQLVEAMGGKIGVKSTLGKGALFWVEIPFLLSELPKHEITKNKKTAPPQTEVLPKIKAYVLLVEDNPLNQKVAKAMLEDLGCKLDIANNGVEALNFLIKNHYDLAFMDISLPDMDGMMITRQVRNREQNNEHLPIIALTAHALPEERQHFIEAGMDSVITKPIEQKQLYEALIKFLNC